MSAAASLSRSFLALARALDGRPQSGGQATAATIDALRRRDERAWTVLFEREAPALLRYAYARLGRWEDAEDAVSRVFQEAWQHIDGLEDRGLPPRAWLFGIARHVVRTARRRLLRRPPVISLEAVAAATPGPDPQQLELVHALRRLPAKDAEVVTLRFLHGLSLAETALAMGTTVDAVKARQARALRRLRAALEASPTARGSRAPDRGR